MNHMLRFLQYYTNIPIYSTPFAPNINGNESAIVMPRERWTASEAKIVTSYDAIRQSWTLDLHCSKCNPLVF